MTFVSAREQFTPDPAFCLNFDSNTFYIDGVQKSISADLTAVGDGYTGTDLSWLTPAAFTVVVEYSIPATGLTLGSNDICVFSLYNTSTASRFEINLIDSDESGGSQFGFTYANGSTAIDSSTADNRLFGRHRLAVSFADGSVPMLAMDCDPITTGSSTLSATTFNKIGVGINALNDTQQAGEITIHKVEVLNGARTQAQLEAIMDASDQGLRPTLMIGSSLNNKQNYSDGGGIWSQVLKDRTTRYLPFRMDQVGGTSPTQQATRWLAMPTRYRAFDLIWSEIGLDGNAAAYQAAIESVRAVHTGRLAIVEPQRDLRHVPGDSGRINVDAVRSWLETYTAANDYLYITTLSEMQAKDPTDTYVTTHGTFPSSAYIDVVTDPIHYNVTGNAWMGDVIQTQLVAARWL